MNEITALGPWRLLSAYLFLLLLLFIVKGLGVGREKEILFSTLRMTLQLTVMGYILVYIFGQTHAFISVLIFALMLFFAVHNIYGRIKTPLHKKLRRVVAFSIVSGTVVTTLYFLLLVFAVEPWYDSRYFIPIAGMIIGNSMTGISLGAERLTSEMKAKRDLIEGALMLGATPKDATLTVVRDTFSAAIMPTINSMVGMGIIFLPGMMTGQILAGASPLTAIEYQIAIMLAILGSVSITLYLLTRFGYLTFFDSYSRLEEISSPES